MIFNSKKAELGIGALILFIAIILIASAVAGVLIKSTSSMKDKVVETTGDVKDQISTNLEIIEISAEDGSDGNVETFYVMMRLAAGSEPINLESLIMNFNLYNTSTVLTYKDGDLILDQDGGYYTSGSKGNYTVEYVFEGKSFIEGSLNTDDIVKLYFQSPRSVGTDEDVAISLIPKKGMQSRVEFQVPSVISKTREYLYP